MAAVLTPITETVSTVPGAGTDDVPPCLIEPHPDLTRTTSCARDVRRGGQGATKLQVSGPVSTSEGRAWRAGSRKDLRAFSEAWTWARGRSTAPHGREETRIHNPLVYIYIYKHIYIYIYVHMYIHVSFF